MRYERFTAQNSAMILIDHQIGTMSWAKSMPFERLKSHALMLAKTAAILKLPVVLTSSMEEAAQGPLLDEFADILPEAFAARIKRVGIVNAMDDPAFAAAVQATGRNKLIVAGVTNDVCTVYPTLTMTSLGYQVQVVADAGASPDLIPDVISLWRMDKHGATLTSTNQLIAELAGSWATPEGAQLVQVLMEGMQA